MALWRSILFVPATRPDRYQKAFASPADMVCIDLEDAVARSEKLAARDTVIGFLNGSDVPAGRCMVRINSPRIADGAADLAAIAGLARNRPAIMLPKTESTAEITCLHQAIGTSVVPMIESAAGLATVENIARMAAQGVAALAFGSADFAADIGATMAWEALAYARGRIVAAAALGRVPAIDGVWFDLQDMSGLNAETRRVAALGFVGRLAVHPAQLPAIHAAFRPDAAAVAHAQRVIAAAAQVAGGVCVVDGKMVDQPVITAAEQTLARASADDGVAPANS
ncbi:MAG: HpcH/HpaI aldolase/citrate lyase family protein [Alphaproteobacteria bacterium]